MEKLAPRQHVSAFVSHSLSAWCPGVVGEVVGCAAMLQTLLVVKTLEIVAPAASQLFLLLLNACSFLPPIILDLVACEAACETWLM